MQSLLPRVYMVIEEINRRFLEEMNAKYPDQGERNYNISILKDGNVHMAHLAIIGSHSVNGVAELHSKILREETFREFYEVYPERFNSVTNGVTPRRFMMGANPDLKDLIDNTIGTSWKNANQLSDLKQLEAHLDDKNFWKVLTKSSAPTRNTFALTSNNT